MSINFTFILGSLVIEIKQFSCICHGRICLVQPGTSEYFEIAAHTLFKDIIPEITFVFSRIDKELIRSVILFSAQSSHTLEASCLVNSVTSLSSSFIFLPWSRLFFFNTLSLFDNVRTSRNLSSYASIITFTQPQKSRLVSVISSSDKWLIYLMMTSQTRSLSVRKTVSLSLLTS